MPMSLNASKAAADSAVSNEVVDAKPDGWELQGGAILQKLEENAANRITGSRSTLDPWICWLITLDPRIR